jgi:phosphate transport system substrate-binding protein
VKRLRCIEASLALAVGAAACGDGKTVEIQNLGSDTMLEVAAAWADAYHLLRLDVDVSLSGGGSAVGITGIIDGTVDIANCSREMDASEIARAEANGHHPVQHMVGYDGIAIYVHKDNPLASITVAQLREVYAEGGKITKWSQLGAKMPAGTTDDIVLVSRQNNSGTYEYFQEHVLGKANFRLGTRDQNGSKDVVDLVSGVPAAIGYSGLAYATPAVRILPVRADEDSPAVVPSIDSVLDRSYAIARPLFMYTQGEPQGEVKEYLAWIVSDAGQRVLQKKGYPPLRKL